MTSECCQTEIEPRKIPFGKAGAIEVKTCACEAMRLCLKYANSKFSEEVPDL